MDLKHELVQMFNNSELTEKNYRIKKTVMWMMVVLNHLIYLQLNLEGEK